MLPRLAYHNPSIPMVVARSDDKDSPCVLSVHLASPSSDGTPTTETSPNVLEIDMKMKQESEILSQLIQMTGARQVEPTTEEVEMMRDLEQQKVKCERDSTRSRAARAQWKKEQDMLRQAREGAL
jgi:large subunit ribosomal protein MRP49